MRADRESSCGGRTRKHYRISHLLPFPSVFFLRLSGVYGLVYVFVSFLFCFFLGCGCVCSGECVIGLVGVKAGIWVGSVGLEEWRRVKEEGNHRILGMCEPFSLFSFFLFAGLWLWLCGSAVGCGLAPRGIRDWAELMRTWVSFRRQRAEKRDMGFERCVRMARVQRS